MSKVPVYFSKECSGLSSSPTWDRTQLSRGLSVQQEQDQRSYGGRSLQQLFFTLCCIHAGATNGNALDGALPNFSMFTLYYRPRVGHLRFPSLPHLSASGGLPRVQPWQVTSVTAVILYLILGSRSFILYMDFQFNWK